MEGFAVEGIATVYSDQNFTIETNSMTAPSQSPALLAVTNLASHLGQNSLNSRMTFSHFLQIMVASLTKFSLRLLGRPARQTREQDQHSARQDNSVLACLINCSL